MSDPPSRAPECSDDQFGSLSWIERDGQLWRGEASRSPASASEVYEAEFGDGAGTPSTQLPSLIISKFPCTAGVRIVVEHGASNMPCRVEEIIWLPSGEVATPANPMLANQVIHNGVWHPVYDDSFDFVQEVKAFLGSSLPARITLARYLRLLEMASDSDLLLDAVGDTLSGQSLAARLQPLCLPTVNATLYPYQQTGVAWLAEITKQDLGCVLGDEMGLGKTLQVLSLVAHEVGAGRRPNLVIAPPSLLENWRRESARFVPHLGLLIHAGRHRTGFPRILADHDLVVSSYDTLKTDLGLFMQVQWNVAVLDEAQAIKNPDAQRTKAAKSLPRRAGLAVSGTPLQNSLLDIWSLLDFCVPGLMGDRSSYSADAGLDESVARHAERTLTPLMLRRLVSAVANDLPPRVEIPETLVMGQAEAYGYEELRQRFSGQGLAALQPLRMYCAHPCLIESPQDGPDDGLDSAKYVRLLELLDEIVATGERALVFTSYVRMIDRIVATLAEMGVTSKGIDGRIPPADRQAAVDALNAGKLQVLVLNPQVGGTGLNITGANHVIHYNLEWNPASIDQASARAHRRGQKRTVFVHYLAYAGTIEEVIQARVHRKREVADLAVVGTDGTDLDAADLAVALSMSPIAYVQGET